MRVAAQGVVCSNTFHALARLIGDYASERFYMLIVCKIAKDRNQKLFRIISEQCGRVTLHVSTSNSMYSMKSQKSNVNTYEWKRTSEIR